MARNSKGQISAEDNPKPFTSENQPPNRGRKPRVFTQISKEFQARGIERATPEVVAEVYEYLLALTMEEIQDISFGLNQTDDLPAIMALAAQEMRGKRTIEIIREMLDRAHGRPTSRHEIAGDMTLRGGSVADEKTIEALKRIAESD